MAIRQRGGAASEWWRSVARIDLDRQRDPEELIGLLQEPADLDKVQAREIAWQILPLGVQGQVDAYASALVKRFAHGYAVLLRSDERTHRSASTPATASHHGILTDQIEKLHNDHGAEPAVREQLANALGHAAAAAYLQAPGSEEPILERPLKLADRYAGEPVFGEVEAKLAGFCASVDHARASESSAGNPQP